MTGSALKAALKIGVSARTVFYGLVPAIADLNETHLFNPLWSEHERFHGAWFLAFAAGIALIALFLIWVRDDVLLPIMFGLIFVAAFWVATVFGSSYGGALVDENGYVQRVLGIESNMFLFSVVGSLLLIALVLASRVSGERQMRD
ncbi:MAG: DUF6640 family protein [Pseudomonadota bacterium]